MRPFLLALAAFAVASLIAAEDCTAQDNAGDSFEDALILPPGTLSVSEELLYVDGFLPDLYLGIRDEFGSFYAEDDDSSRFGDSFAPGLEFLPTNPGGVIDFAVSGFEEIPFAGEHFAFGQFEVYVDIYTNDGGFSFIDSLLLEGFIEEGQIIDFYESDLSWDGAVYDVNVNNAFPNDVDFFRFTGLTPGEAFTAETLEVEGGFIDTVLGLFDESGQLIDSADEGGEFNYSKLTGVVPANGELVLAVSGFPDIDSFDGFHPFFGPYELSLTIGEGNVVGDYDGDLDVDADDYTAWANAYGDTGTGLAADGNGDGVVDAADYTIWRDALGAAQAAAVPEPVGLVLVLFAMTAVPAGRKRSR